MSVRYKMIQGRLTNPEWIEGKTEEERRESAKQFGTLLGDSFDFDAVEEYVPLEELSTVLIKRGWVPLGSPSFAGGGKTLWARQAFWKPLEAEEKSV